MLPHQQLQNSPSQPINLTPRHPNDYIMMNQKQLLNQQQPLQNQQQPRPQEANLPQQFSQPNYDPQIKINF
jgi:hypothetical protein